MVTIVAGSGPSAISLLHGGTSQQVLDAATPHGPAPLVGSAPGVGVVGFLTGGGIGPLVRTTGLSSDRVLARPGHRRRPPAALAEENDPAGVLRVGQVVRR